jgi:hypothetical protein
VPDTETVEELKTEPLPVFIVAPTREPWATALAPHNERMPAPVRVFSGRRSFPEGLT